MVLEAAMYQKAVSYISQADALNFLLSNVAQRSFETHQSVDNGFLAEADTCKQ